MIQTNKFIITRHNKKNNCVFIEGQVQIDNTSVMQNFQCKISHNEFILGKNDESNINVSDNRGGFYNIQLIFLDNNDLIINSEKLSEKLCEEFSYVKYNIPSYVWCIARGLMFAEL